MALQDKLVPEASLDYLDYQVLMDCLERMVNLAKLDQKETRDLKDTLDLLDSQAQEESKEILVREELRERRVKKVKSGWRDRKETWE